MQKFRAVSVVAVALGVNLIIGVLYAWSIFKEAILASIAAGGATGFDWAPSAVNDPFALCCLMFALSMMPAGRLQHRYGSRLTTFLGGVLGGLGFLIIAYSTEYWLWMLGFGGLVGAGIGFAYASTTPVALRWFCYSQSGLVTGIVVSGFALASIYVVPLASYLLRVSDLHQTMLFFSAQFMLMLSLFAYFLHSPPAHHVPVGAVERRQVDNQHLREALAQLDHVLERPMAALKEKQFWLLWVLLFLGAGAGLMVIGNIKPLAKASMGEMAYMAIVILAVGDAVGRVLTGVLSTHYGRKRVLMTTFFAQMLLMFATFGASQSGSALQLMIVTTLIGINYGANLVLFPNLVKDLWGDKHFGVIYGMLFSAWGLGGFVMVKLSEHLQHHAGGVQQSFMLAGALILFGVCLIFKVDDRKDKARIAIRAQHHLDDKEQRRLTKLASVSESV